MSTLADNGVAAGGEVRLVPLNSIDTRAGFNPRGERDPERFAQLVASVKADGVLVPLLVTPNGDGGYLLVAGEGRYLAAGEAGQTEVPVYVRSVDGRTGGLELALAENLARHDLDLVQEALGFQRLRDAGLTRKGIAERLGIAQKRITERLEILKLPEALHPGLASGAIPPAAVKPLVRLAKIHPGLPEAAAARVGAPPAQPWSEPLTWGDVVRDPIGALIADFDGKEPGLPTDVFDAGDTYPIERFTLTDTTREQLRELCGLLELPVEAFEVRFGREALEQATKLGAAHASGEGWHHLIVGQDVADQLAGDYIATCLKVQRDTEARIATAEAPAGGGVSGEGKPGGEPEFSAEEHKAQRRAEREAEQRARRAAEAFNAELGAAVLKQLARLKVDADVLKVITAVDVAGDLGGLAARGARYGFPGWPRSVEQKNGKTKVEYLSKEDAQAKARAFLEQAKTPADIAGRLFCLIAMARYANETDAVANSNRSFHELRAGGGLPWSDEVIDLVDRVCGERLPEHLTAAVRERRAAQRAEAEQREHERAEALARLDGIEQRAGELGDDERAQAIADIETVHGRYSTEAWRLIRLLREPADEQAPGGEDADGHPASDDGDDTEAALAA